jgi:threonyl-tRNA synthetase
MNNKKQEIIKHSTAHILAAAVLEMFPEAKFGTGPATEEGFYYDFDLPRTLIPEDLPLLEEKMREIIKANYPFEKEDISTENATEHFQKAAQNYKVEIIKDLQSEGNKKVTIYKTGNFIDLCSGPHIDSTGEINSQAFKLTKISGAYWRADENNTQMQRIYGVVFSDKKELKNYLFQKEEAEKRDHKKLGKEFDLFSFHSEAPGSAFWHPNGMVIWNELESFGKNLRKKYGFKEIQTPILAKNTLWKKSGHWDHYKDSMFYFDVDKETYCLKPMDCPFNIKIYQTAMRSYRDLPVRYTEIGRIMRNEKSGELNGLFRVRHLTQDDSHIFSEKKHIKKEIKSLLKMTKEYYGVFGIKPEFFLSTRPEDFMGKIEDWNEAEKNLKDALKEEDVEYEIKEKDGAFYGPKIDIDIKDAIGRRWQLATIQLDFQLPVRFDLEYINNEGKKEIPVMIHAAVFGSFERFIGIITEHFAGAFPLWLSPVQVKIIPISEKFEDYAKEVEKKLLENNIRVELSFESESLGKRISAAEKQKIPYMLVVGEKEREAKTVAIRKRGDKKQEVLPLEEFAEKIKKEIEGKK